MAVRVGLGMVRQGVVRQSWQGSLGCGVVRLGLVRSGSRGAVQSGSLGLGLAVMAGFVREGCSLAVAVWRGVVRSGF